MKKIIIYLIIMILSYNGFSSTLQEILGIEEQFVSYGGSPADAIFFYNDSSMLIDGEGSSDEHINCLDGEYTYNIRTEKKIMYLEIKNEKLKETFMILVNKEMIILYKKGRTEPYWKGYNTRESERLYRFGDKRTKASSELKEGDKVYAVSNLWTLESGKPWVEGVKGNGIGEYIENTINGKTIYIFSGYVDVEKPYLYEQNSRPKRISVETPTQTLYYDLKDTPNPQKIEISEKDYINDYNVRITILEVYPGTKYEDTCINSIIGFWEWK